jgi:integrase
LFALSVYGQLWLMAGKQAKTLSDTELRRLLRLVRKGRYAARDRVMVLLSVKAGLRACEIAGLTWAMALDATQRVGPLLEVRDGIAKKRRGRAVAHTRGSARRPAGPLQGL